MAWQDRRNAVLEGSSKAAEVHEQLSLRARVGDGSGPIDVFRVITDMDVGFLFRPLDKLLGAFLPAPVRGIVVTTQRDLYVQRYTAAHELGHFLLDHEVSLDDERLIGFAPRGAYRDPQEIAADAFASELLMPRWLVAAHVRRQQWTADALRTPGVVYQLSLRLGVSYEAMCWGLEGHRAISREDAQRLARIAPKATKTDALRGPFLTHPRANVWSLTSNDSGLMLVGASDDVIQIELRERASAGLTWNVDVAAAQGFQILDDEQRAVGGIGAFGVRRFALKGSGTLDLCLQEGRQWDTASEPSKTFGVRFSLEGRESGIPRACRDARVEEHGISTSH